MPRKPKARILGRKGFAKQFNENYFGVLTNSKKGFPEYVFSVKDLKFTKK